jgi:hypothetical protein
MLCSVQWNIGENDTTCETRQEGCRFVSEKTFKALLGRGQAVVVGTRGVLAYLHSPGVCTWSDQIAEQYDCIPDADQRLAAAMDSALEYISRTGTDDPGLAEVREANLRWLVSAPKPWDLCRPKTRSCG